MDNKSPEAFRTISEVAEWLGVPAHVLRFWESRFGQVKPVKRAGGRRYYRPSDMELLGGIRKLLHDDGMTIRGVQKLLRENGVKHVAAMSPPIDQPAELRDVTEDVAGTDAARPQTAPSTPVLREDETGDAVEDAEEVDAGHQDTTHEDEGTEDEGPEDVTPAELIAGADDAAAASEGEGEETATETPKQPDALTETPDVSAPTQVELPTSPDARQPEDSPADAADNDDLAADTVEPVDTIGDTSLDDDALERPEQIEARSHGAEPETIETEPEAAAARFAEALEPETEASGEATGETPPSETHATDTPPDISPEISAHIPAPPLDASLAEAGDAEAAPDATTPDESESAARPEASDAAPSEENTATPRPGAEATDLVDATDDAAAAAPDPTAPDPTAPEPPLVAPPVAEQAVPDAAAVEPGAVTPGDGTAALEALVDDARSDSSTQAEELAGVDMHVTPQEAASPEGLAPDETGADVIADSEAPADDSSRPDHVTASAEQEPAPQDPGPVAADETPEPDADIAMPAIGPDPEDDTAVPTGPAVAAALRRHRAGTAPSPLSTVRLRAYGDRLEALSSRLGTSGEGRRPF